MTYLTIFFNTSNIKRKTIIKFMNTISEILFIVFPKKIITILC